MDRNLKTGDAQKIVELLHQSKPGWAMYSKPALRFVWESDCSEVDALMAECAAERAKCLDSRERDRVLRSYQQKEYSLNVYALTLGSNIYGYAVGDTLRSNLGGGRWAMTPQGYSLEEALAWGVETVQRGKNRRFTVLAANLPADVLLMVVGA